MIGFILQSSKDIHDLTKDQEVQVLIQNSQIQYKFLLIIQTFELEYV